MRRVIKVTTHPTKDASIINGGYPVVEGPPTVLMEDGGLAINVGFENNEIVIEIFETAINGDFTEQIFKGEWKKIR